MGTTLNWIFSCDRFRCKNFESGRVFWILRYFVKLFCWFSASVIQWARQSIPPLVMIGSVAKLLSLLGFLGFHLILGPCFVDSPLLWSSGHYSELNFQLWLVPVQKKMSLVALLNFTLFWDPVLLIFRSCDPVGTTVNCTFSYGRFRCKNFESGRLVLIPRYFGILFCWFSAPVIQCALQWTELSAVIGSVAKISSLVGSFGLHVTLGPCFVDSPLLWSNGHHSE